MTTGVPPSSYPDSYYAQTTHTRTTRPRLREDLEFEVCVVGGGLAGLSTALSLAERGVNVAVLEARKVGWGASGRNGGFCCPGGSATGLTGLVKQVGADNAREYARVTEDAVNLVRDLGIEGVLEGCDDQTQVEALFADQGAGKDVGFVV